MVATQIQKNTYNFLAGIHNNIVRGNALSISRRVRGAPSGVVELICRDPAFAAYIEELLHKVERGNYAGINSGNFSRRADVASAAVAKALNNAARENNARVKAANVARLQRTRNAAEAAARNLAAARNASSAAGANRAARNAARNAAAANRAANQTTGRATAARQAARQANMNARAAARLAETRARREAADSNQAAFNTAKARWEANFNHRRAQGRSVREVIHNMAHQHLHVNIPVNGNITRVHRVRIHPDRGNNKALRTVLTTRLP
jgi:hypothetical protein